MPDLLSLSRQADAPLPAEAEHFLHDFRKELLSLPESERVAIVNEVREQIVAQAALGHADMVRLLKRLGSADRLGREFVLHHASADGGSRLRPVRLFLTARKLGAVGATSLSTLALALLAYLLAAAFCFIIFWKLVEPEEAGLWRTPGGNFFLGMSVDNDPITRGHELLGTWIFPLSFCASVVFLVIGNSLVRATARSLLRRFRRRDSWTS